MASSSDALPPEFLQRAQQGGIVVTGRPSLPSDTEKLSCTFPLPAALPPEHNRFADSAMLRRNP